MTGNMVNVIPPNDNSDKVDGAACVDNNQKYVSFIFGGPNDGTINTTFRNLPSFISSKARVKIEKIDWVNKDAVSYGPKTVSNSVYNVVNGQTNQRWNIKKTNDGYYILQNINSGKVLDVEYGSNENGANVIQWYSNNGYNQQWRLVRVN